MPRPHPTPPASYPARIMPRPQVTIAPNATALTIAGSDPSGGAGLQVDLKAFQQNGVYGMSAVTLLTVQNTVGVRRVETLPPDLILEQLDAVLGDIAPQAIKTGALGSAENIVAISQRLADYGAPLIVDPVLVSKHGDSLADDSCVDAYRQALFPLATLITPNRFEAERLLGKSLEGADDDTLLHAAAELCQWESKHALLKAGRVGDERSHFFVAGDQVTRFSVPHLNSKQTHGAGCALSAVITARMALDPKQDLREATQFAIAAVHHAIEFAPELGSGCGPVEPRVLHIGT